MRSIDDLLHSLLIRPESKRVGKCGGEGERWDRGEDHSERTEGLLGNKGD